MNNFAPNPTFVIVNFKKRPPMKFFGFVQNIFLFGALLLPNTVAAGLVIADIRSVVIFGVVVDLGLVVGES